MSSTVPSCAPLVTDPEGPCHQKKDACERILEDVLRRKADCDAANSECPEHGRRVDGGQDNRQREHRA